MGSRREEPKTGFSLTVDLNEHAAVLGHFTTVREAKNTADPYGQFSWLDTDDDGATTVVGGMTLTVETL
jgi:hypothetical protein